MSIGTEFCESMKITTAARMLGMPYENLRERYESLPEEARAWCMDYIDKLCEKDGDVTKGIKFENEDVPRYLAHLRYLKNRPSKIGPTTLSNLATAA